jgi:hypothetical protein
MLFRTKKTRKDLKLFRRGPLRSSTKPNDAAINWQRMRVHALYVNPLEDARTVRLKTTHISFSALHLPPSVTFLLSVCICKKNSNLSELITHVDERGHFIHLSRKEGQKDH